MIIETWILALFIILISASNFVALVGWMTVDHKLEESQKENNLLRDKNRILEGKLIVKTATEFYNEGKKK